MSDTQPALENGKSTNARSVLFTYVILNDYPISLILDWAAGVRGGRTGVSADHRRLIGVKEPYAGGVDA